MAPGREDDVKAHLEAHEAVARVEALISQYGLLARVDADAVPDLEDLLASLEDVEAVRTAALPVGHT